MPVVGCIFILYGVWMIFFCKILVNLSIIFTIRPNYKDILVAHCPIIRCIWSILWFIITPWLLLVITLPSILSCDVKGLTKLPLDGFAVVITTTAASQVRVTSWYFRCCSTSLRDWNATLILQAGGLSYFHDQSYWKPLLLSNSICL